jgi:hypothetical protein
MPDRQEQKTLNWVQMEARRSVARQNRKRLYVGEGCCCPMNTDRNDIPPPDEKNAPGSRKTCQDPYLTGVCP